MMKSKTLFRKEALSYLNSSVALIFLGTFLVLTLFTFFVADKFFERNIADLRPLFHWLPVLLIFLVSALTMRSWAEEKSQGTLELLMTWPVKIGQLVTGKFLGVMALIIVALALTFPLPLTVAFLGSLDWGPVIGGYLGALLVAAAYTAIGLWISSITANQIVALFLTGLSCAFFYVIGSEVIVSLLPNQLAEVLSALGTGSRFESIARGVVDVRDVIYYLSLTVFFGLLNIYSLSQSRWGKDALQGSKPHHRQWGFVLVLVLANLLALNLWLSRLNSLRLDLTARREYTISRATRNILRDLKEPLTIKFYTSETHPLLKPLVPQVRDLIKEYEIVSRGKVRGFVVDPTENDEAEKEANQDYNIKPVPFQVPGRHEMKIVNSYFNILILYGDQHAVLGFDDLIELNVSGMNDIEVKLRNLEYDLTRSIKKVVYGFQGLEELFAAVDEPITAKIYYTSKTLPEPLRKVPEEMQKIYEDVAKHSGGKFSFELVDVSASDASGTIEQLQKDYGLKPFAISPFTREVFLLHTILQKGKQTQVLYPTGDFQEKSIRDSLETALKREAKGFLRTVGLLTPSPRMPQMPGQFGRRPPGEDSYELLTQQLEQDYKVNRIELSSGSVPKDVDLLLIVKPRSLEESEKFAVDQFLMQGGTVVVASGAYEMVPQPGAMGGGGSRLGMQPLQGGLEDLLGSYGVSPEKSLVMDLQNEKFPVPVLRQVGPFQVQEIQLIDYPFFVDIRQDEMLEDHPALSGLVSVTLNWASPLAVNDEKAKAGKIKRLISSSKKSWVQVPVDAGAPDIEPNFDLYPKTGYKVPDHFESETLVAAVEGPFTSFYKGKISPLTQKEVSEASTKKEKNKKAIEPPSAETDRVIESSPESSRLIVIGSGDFISDTVLNLSRNSGQDRFQNSLQFMQNLIDWSLEDTDLIAIRSRGTFARTLFPVPKNVKMVIELTNYGLVLLSLTALGVWVKVRRRRVKPLPFPLQKFARDVEEPRKETIAA